MKGKVCLLSLIIVLVADSFDDQNLIPGKWIYHDFDTAMQKEAYPGALVTTTKIVGIDGNNLYNFFKRLYEQNNLSRITISEQERIPKIIHQVWLSGSDKPVPVEFVECMQSVVDNHLGRGWRYKLWTDSDIDKLDLVNREFYDATDNFGLKSDIARMEIIYLYGGAYLDIDFECLQPLDILHYAYDFYAGIQPLDSLFVQLNNAFFAARPGHPILKHCIETVKDDWKKHHGAPQKAGPVHFTRSFYTIAQDDMQHIIALPPIYLYPLGTKDALIKREEWLQQGSFAFHWWAKTWMPKKYRRSKFQSIDNDESTVSWNN